MQTCCEIRIIFKNDIQGKRFDILDERTISPTYYPDFPCLVNLGLADSVCFMFSQMSWDMFSVAKHPNYISYHFQHWNS